MKELVRDNKSPDSEPSKVAQLHGCFERERACKHSVRYKPINGMSREIASIIYINNEALRFLDNPSRIWIVVRSSSSALNNVD